MLSIEEQLNTICKHNREKKECKTCRYYCQHNTRKERCIECGGGSICEHDKIKARCRLCNGSQICEHDKLKARCRICNGSAFCEHNKRKETCQICEPIKHLIYLQRHQIWRIMQQTNLEKTQPSIEYLGCSAVYF